MLKEFKFSHGLFARYAKLVCDSVVPFQEAVLRDRIEGVAPSHAIENFKLAAKLHREGKLDENEKFYGMVFQDSDVAKWIEAAAYSLVIKPDEELLSRIDEMCDIIAEAQEEDGYLDTYFTLSRPDKKFNNLLEGHELYCSGHMMEAAVALYEVTGNEKLLRVMKKNGDLLYRHFVENGAEGYPGHPEIELALMRLWRATGDEKYKELSEHFVNVRGVDPDFYVKERENRDWQVWGNNPRNRTYQQSHLPVREQTDAVGHSVRAVYLYTAMADIASVTKEPALAEACYKLFESISKRRMYITGGIGSTVHGEAFTADFDLPNDTVYAETCASIGLVFFLSKLLKLNRDGRYADVIERAIYNTVLAGIELDGKKFFYVNPLEVIPGISGKIDTHRHDLPQRPGWFGCACCPPNAARLLTSIAQYAWDKEGDVLYSNLYAAGELTLPEVTVDVETDYPFGDTVTYKVKKGGTKLAIHIPEFTKKNYTVSAIGEFANGYYYLDVNEGDVIEVKLDMTPKLNRANPSVARDSGLGAVTVGPVVYCAEGVDNGGEILGFSFDGAKFTLKSETPEEIGGFAPVTYDLGAVYTITAEGKEFVSDNGDDLYFTDGYREEKRTIKLIPYFMWGNRGLNQMRIWMPVK